MVQDLGINQSSEILEIEKYKFVSLMDVFKKHYQAQTKL